MVIQVPLKQEYIRPSSTYYPDGFGGNGIGAPGVLLNQHQHQHQHHLKEEEHHELLSDDVMRSATRRKMSDSDYVESRKAALQKSQVDMESAIIKVGETEGKFTEVNGLPIERDPDYPIRVTYQFYKSTATGVINEAEVSGIADEIAASRAKGDFVGSLVVGGNKTKRPTDTTSIAHQIPEWWDVFWFTYGERYQNLTKDVASALLFSNSRFKQTTMDEAQGHCLAILNQY